MSFSPWSNLTFWVSPLRIRLHGSRWLPCSSLQGADHAASSRLASTPRSPTLGRVQSRIEVKGCSASDQARHRRGAGASKAAATVTGPALMRVPAVRDVCGNADQRQAQSKPEQLGAGFSQAEFFL
jgi:hypothetical protein